MPDEIRIGLIGLDTSHVPAFTKLINDAGDPFHVPGGRVVAAYPGGSSDFELSYNRVEGFTTTLRETWSVEVLESPEDVAQTCDAIMITAVDGRTHLPYFREVVRMGKPTFIDKPFAISSSDAKEIFRLADEHKVPVMSTSTMRYAQPLVEVLATVEPLIGADCCGPMSLEPTQPGLFWYGIHVVEMVYAALGRGCLRVTASTTEGSELVTGVWSDGRIGTIRGNRMGSKVYGALLHSQHDSRFVDILAHPQPVYAGLMQQVMAFFQSGRSPVAAADTLEIIRFIEAANESRETGLSVIL